MIVVLLENSIYSIDSLVGKIKSKFPKTSILEVNRSNRYDFLKLSHTVPLLTDGWVIIGNQSMSVEQMLPFCKDTNNLVILHTKPSKKNEVIESLDEHGIKYNLVDNINVSKESLIAYTSTTLSLLEKDAKALCNRCNNYMPYVIEAVTLLQTLGRQVTRNDINTFIQKRTNITINSLFMHMIGYKVLDVSLLATYLYDFKYAFKYVKTKLLEYVEDSIYVYSLIESGVLGSDNYSTFSFDRTLNISEYVLKNLVLHVHSEVSLEMLLLTKIKIQKCTSMFMLLEYI